MARVNTQAAARQTVAILGSGITGLSAAYYINKKFGSAVRPVILESSGRSGGWIKTVHDGKNIYELGPRTIRPFGPQGMNVLDLVEEVGLDNQVQFVPPDHPAAKNRMIYLNEQLVKLPTDMSVLLKTVPPFEKPLYKILLKEIFISRKRGEDDSLHGFVSRRFGSALADTFIDPLIRGITAGDAREISVKFMAGQMYEWEQKYGSVVLGALLSRLRKKKEQTPEIPGLDTMGSSNLAQAARNDRWSVWTLEEGLEALPKRLEEKLSDAGVEIQKESPVKSIFFDPVLNRNVVSYVDMKSRQLKQLECSKIISTIPAWELGRIISESNVPSAHLSQLLLSVTSVDVTVTNLKFTGVDFPSDKEGFGFLVPSYEKSVLGLLGVVFNTCGFPQNGDVILTAMSRGINRSQILKHVEDILGFKNPSYVDSAKLQKCIPQYTVGHYERTEDARRIISDIKLPLILAGASFDGVSVNDCVLSGLKACEKLASDKPGAT